MKNMKSKNTSTPKKVKPTKLSKKDDIISRLTETQVRPISNEPQKIVAILSNPFCSADNEFVQFKTLVEPHIVNEVVNSVNTLSVDEIDNFLTTVSSREEELMEIIREVSEYTIPINSAILNIREQLSQVADIEIDTSFLTKTYYHAAKLLFISRVSSMFGLEGEELDIMYGLLDPKKDVKPNQGLSKEKLTELLSTLVAK